MCIVSINATIAQDRTISGTVTDEQNIPLFGVNILVKNQSVGTITDENGKYSLEVNSSAEILSFTYIGYQDKEVKITGTEINVVLKESDIALDQIVVSSRKRIENVQEVPVAISAFSLKMLEDRGVGNVGDLASLVPNVEIDVNTAFGGSQSVLSPFIRGIGQNDFAITYEPAVGLYVDGVYYGRGVGSVVDMLDIDRIEVLKGPQGTLFGRNTIAGAINVTTKRPGKDFGASAQLSTGSYNRLDTRITIDMPIIENKLLSSFSVATNNRDGFVERIPFQGDISSQDVPVASQLGDGQYTNVGNSDDQGNYNNQTWRAKLLYDVSDKIDITLAADYVRIRENENPASLLAVIESPDNIVGAYNLATQIPPSVPVDQQPPFTANIAGLEGQNPLFGRTPYDERFLTGDPFKSYATAEAGSRIDVWGASLTFKWDISDKLTFKSITSVRSLRSEFGQDGDQSPLDWSRLKLTMPQDQFTQEFQLSGNSDKFKWIAGLYHFREDGSILDQVFFGAGLIQVLGLNIVENETYAAYAQGTYDFTDKWSVTGGIRYTYEDKYLDGRQRDLNGFGTWFLPDEAFPDPTDRTLYYPAGGHSQNFSVPTVRLGTEYKISDDMFAYGYFAQGFKSGGWSTRLTAPSLTAPSHNPEKANTFELGLKSEFAKNRVRLNVAGFYTDYQDMQVTVFVGVSPTVVNAAEAVIKGVEADLQWRASDHVFLNANIGLLDAKYTEINNPNAAIQEDFRFLNAPSFSGGMGVDLVSSRDYDKSRVGLHLDMNYRSTVANDVENSSFLIQDGFALFNGSLFYEPAGRKWKITIGGTNLSNETYLNAGTFNPGLGNVYGVYGRPIEFNTSISFKL